MLHRWSKKVEKTFGHLICGQLAVSLFTLCLTLYTMSVVRWVNFWKFYIWLGFLGRFDYCRIFGYRFLSIWFFMSNIFVLLVWNLRHNQGNCEYPLIVFKTILIRVNKFLPKYILLFGTIFPKTLKRILWYLWRTHSTIQLFSLFLVDSF